jgi:hypothetical protein
MDHRQLSQHKKNQRTEFLVKWEKNIEVLWEKDTNLWQFKDHFYSNKNVELFWWGWFVRALGARMRQ